MCSTENAKTLLDTKFDKNLDFILCGKVDEIIQVVEKDVLLQMAFKKHHSKININANNNFDENYVHSLNNSQLTNLIRFYTIFEKDFYFRGSVTAIPYLLKVLAERGYENYEFLVNWVLETDNGNNPYVAFGEIKYGECRSLKEYKELVVELRSKQQHGEEDAQFRHEERLSRQKTTDAKNVWNAIRRKDVAAISAMLQRGLDINAVNEHGLTVKQAMAEQELDL